MTLPSSTIYVKICFM